MNKAFVGTALLALAAALAGCSGNHVTYGNECMTCINNPITGEPVNYAPTEYSTAISTSQSPASGSRSVPHTLAREQVEIAYAQNVDTVGMRLKDAFGYMTQDEAIAQMGNAGKMAFAGPGYAYQASPGAFYFMKTQAYNGDLSTRVTRAGNGAKAVITYEQKRSGGKDIQSVMREVKARAEKALQ